MKNLTPLALVFVAIFLILLGFSGGMLFAKNVTKSQAVVIPFPTPVQIMVTPSVEATPSALPTVSTYNRYVVPTVKKVGTIK